MCHETCRSCRVHRSRSLLLPARVSRVMRRRTCISEARRRTMASLNMKQPWSPTRSVSRASSFSTSHRCALRLCHRLPAFPPPYMNCNCEHEQRPSVEQSRRQTALETNAIKELANRHSTSYSGKQKTQPTASTHTNNSNKQQTPHQPNQTQPNQTQPNHTNTKTKPRSAGWTCVRTHAQNHNNEQQPDQPT